MADFDSKLPIRSLAVDNTTEIADSAGTTINPAKEDGNLLAIKNQTDNLTFAATRLLVDGSGVTQPVSGSVSVSNFPALQPVSIDQTGVNNNVSVINGAGAAAVNIQDGGNSITVDGTVAVSAISGTVAVTQSTSPWVVDGSAVTQPISAVSLPLPTGAATAANQATEIASLAAIDAGIPAALGQTTMANSMPVVIASDQTALPVTFSNTTAEATDFKKATAVAANASDTHTYSPGTTKYLDQVDASASGQLKVEVKVGTTGAETTRWVGFTSKGNLFTSWRLPNPITVPNTDSVLVIVTNFDNQAQDVYSTIMVH
jgi:hypothetical protein